MKSKLCLMLVGVLFLSFDVTVGMSFGAISENKIAGQNATTPLHIQGGVFIKAFPHEEDILRSRFFNFLLNFPFGLIDLQSPFRTIVEEGIRAESSKIALPIYSEKSQDKTKSKYPISQILDDIDDFTLSLEHIEFIDRFIEESNNTIVEIRQKKKEFNDEGRALKRSMNHIIMYRDNYKAFEENTTKVLCAIVASCSQPLSFVDNFYKFICGICFGSVNEQNSIKTKILSATTRIKIACRKNMELLEEIKKDAEELIKLICHNR